MNITMSSTSTRSTSRLGRIQFNFNTIQCKTDVIRKGQRLLLCKNGWDFVVTDILEGLKHLPFAKHIPTDSKRTGS